MFLDKARSTVLRVAKAGTFRLPDARTGDRLRPPRRAVGRLITRRSTANRWSPSVRRATLGDWPPPSPLRRLGCP
jgi:hypothetical protein